MGNLQDTDKIKPTQNCLAIFTLKTVCTARSQEQFRLKSKNSQAVFVRLLTSQ
jgi:hypothetical protein